MGVLGLSPFLQKSFPGVLRTLPNRVQELSGKKVVIDGTLLTQRLHFAPLPHPYRHVLGWYRIIKELKEADVTALCVFDGKERSLAKKMEIERRRHLRKITAARGTFEIDRLRRLRKIPSLLGSWRSLDISEQAKTANTLRNVVAGRTAPLPSLPSAAHGDPHHPKKSFADYWHLAVGREAYGDFREADVSEILLKRAGIPVSSSQELDAEPFTTLDYVSAEKGSDEVASLSAGDLGVSLSQGRPLGDADLTRVDESCELVDELLPETSSIRAELEHAPRISSDELASSLSSLYMEYRQGIPQLESMPHPASVAAPHGTDDPAVSREEYAMSKTQLQLTTDEGKFWHQLAEHGSREDTQVAITVLTQKSSIISESYERRTNPPSAETYEECKAILHAMGVPCIDTSGPYEAEALACSLVIHGHADYVASEDTDVLIYEAPLIRNLANRRGPLVTISGTEVRTALQLDRSSFVDFALLLGTDFSQRIKNVGPQRALKFIREYGSIERVLECEPQYPPRVPPQVYLQSVDMARSVFQTLPPLPDGANLEPGKSDDEAIAALLRRFGLSRELSHDDEWNCHAALDGNFFEDNPSAS